MTKHRKVLSLEKEILSLLVTNECLAPFSEYRSKLITIKPFGKSFHAYLCLNVALEMILSSVQLDLWRTR
jgi:hypothetical protein